MLFCRLQPHDVARAAAQVYSEARDGRAGVTDHDRVGFGDLWSP